MKKSTDDPRPVEQGDPPGNVSRMTDEEFRSALGELVQRYQCDGVPSPQGVALRTLHTVMIANMLAQISDDLMVEVNGYPEPKEPSEPTNPVTAYAALPEDVDIRDVDQLTIALRWDCGVEEYVLERGEGGMFEGTCGGVQTIPSKYVSGEAEDAEDRRGE